MSAIIQDKITQVPWKTHKPEHITHTHTHTHSFSRSLTHHTNTHTYTHKHTDTNTRLNSSKSEHITHTHTMSVNLSDDLYEDRPSSGVDIFRMKEDHQTGQEHSLSAINRSHRSLLLSWLWTFSCLSLCVSRDLWDRFIADSECPCSPWWSSFIRNIYGKSSTGEGRSTYKSSLIFSHTVCVCVMLSFPDFQECVCVFVCLCLTTWQPIQSRVCVCVLVCSSVCVGVCV